MTLYDDTDFVRAELGKLVEEQGKQVVAVFHSYGGIVGSQAVSPELAYSHRHASGRDGGVLWVVYLASFMLPSGTSLADNFTEEALAAVAFIASDGSSRPRDPHQSLSNFMDKEQASHWISLTDTHVHRTAFDKLTYAAYQHHPVACIFAKQDAAIPPDAQRAMAKAANVPAEDLYEVDSDHSPFLTRTAETVQILEKIALADARV